MTASIDDEERWAQAQSLLDRVPTEPAARKARRQRRNLVLATAVLALACVGVALVFFLSIAPGSVSSEGDEPLWREITGLVLAPLGAALSVVVLVTVIRSNRRLHAWSGNPMAPLSRRQKRELTRQITGRAPVEPERLPLARYAAEALVAARLTLVQQAAVLLLLVGQWIGEPTTWRLVLLLVIGGLSLLVAVPLVRRVAQARRFLEQHPAPAEPA